MDKKRHIVQCVATFLSNINVKGVLNGQLYRGKFKGICIPGLNCYSCPLAVGSCPLGALQSLISTLKTKVSGYVLGVIMLYGVLFGRIICGWLCPFGLLQELLYKIPYPKWNFKVGKIRYIKYIVLAVFVICIPLLVMLDKGIGIPAFCKYICPQGTIAGIILAGVNSAYREMIGLQFLWKFIVLLVILIMAMAIYRPFCRIICPLGALYGMFNAISFIHLDVNSSACSQCGACTANCPMQVDVVKKCNDAECIRCGKCTKVCKEKAVKFK